MPYFSLKKSTKRTLAANNLLKIQLHSIARKELAMLKQLSSLSFHSAEFFSRKLFEAIK
jgi:hypothetical protein